ncbi:hypothetical protein WOLCODRAFT_63391 [Wolfiporia cocos MD-104 SS10]|uniref:AB hydrolase-1 domain-containing protein n=1 Tax=Wolfiporia cocos (strain MD-104) TaxID=742152 RepID=A0A2H3IT14_WOLCO|nr:hypothetical protein WOLCODRAFT_63391 [Wolfiporia cocos MD-104 SS10]
MTTACYSTSTTFFTYPEAVKPGLKLVAKRYVPATPSANGLTLLFAHCTGAHKEFWEPVIEALFENADPLQIREAWSVDWQSHGEAAVLNESLLKQIDGGLCMFFLDLIAAAQEYAVGVRAFVRSPHLAGHRLLGVGHSAGGSAILLSADVTSIPYEAIILVEPCLITRTEFDAHHAERIAALEFTQKAVSGRRDVWRDRAEAAIFFKKRLPWKIWDLRVLHIFIERGLKEISVQEDERTVTKVTLKCDKAQEQKAYANDNEPHFLAVDRLATLDATFPVHCILGARVDIVPPYAHNSILAVRQMASVQRVPKAGHFAVQENPDGVATCIENVLRGIASPRAKL